MGKTHVVVFSQILKEIFQVKQRVPQQQWV